eukprot:GILJ01018695.1.p1 GENE.GILJ01018695.1~~GILJ01018695.1.p1  ORF type:complete len:420 (-),score=14.12 GILJ01018695.1:57-1316(-)
MSSRLDEFIPLRQADFSFLDLRQFLFRQLADTTSLNSRDLVPMLENRYPMNNVLKTTGYKDVYDLLTTVSDVSVTGSRDNFLVTKPMITRGGEGGKRYFPPASLSSLPSENVHNTTPPSDNSVDASPIHDIVIKELQKVVQQQQIINMLVVQQRVQMPQLPLTLWNAPITSNTPTNAMTITPTESTTPTVQRLVTYRYSPPPRSPSPPPPRYRISNHESTREPEHRPSRLPLYQRRYRNDQNNQINQNDWDRRHHKVARSRSPVFDQRRQNRRRSRSRSPQYPHNHHQSRDCKSSPRRSRDFLSRRRSPSPPPPLSPRQRRPVTTWMVLNIPPRWTLRDMEDHFVSGGIDRQSLIKTRIHRHKKGNDTLYGFITLPDATEANLFYDKFNMTPFSFGGGRYVCEFRPAYVQSDQIFTKRL